jgi:NADPH:quinone reductase-like Zn-dependent oxidoreductase
MEHESEKPRDGGVIVPTDAASAAYAQALVRRGEAVRVPPGGTLPPGATHEIVGETPEGVPLLRRRRVALF